MNKSYFSHSFSGGFIWLPVSCRKWLSWRGPQMKSPTCIWIVLILHVIRRRILKGQYISKQNCRAVTSPKNEGTNLSLYPDSPEMIETWERNSSFKYFWTVRIEKEIRLFIFGRSYSSTILFWDLLTFICHIFTKLLWTIFWASCIVHNGLK